MKVLYVINSLNIGGAEKLCVDLIKKAKERGIVIDIYILNNLETFFSKELKKVGINIFNGGSNDYKSIKHVIWLLKNRKKYDVIHSHLSYSQYFVSIIRIFDKKIKLITTEHNTFNERRKFKIFKFIEKNIYNSYSNIVVINKENLNSIMKWQPTIKNKLKIINNGIDIEKYINGKKSEIKDERLLKISGKKKILMIAAYRKQKNHMFMLKVMKNLDENNVLILVGDGEEEIKNQINSYVKKNKLEERIIQLGKRDDIENIIKFCDIAILPSLWEGFGLVAAECMAGGLPVIGSKVEGLSEVIGEKELLFKVNDIEQCIKRVKNVLVKRDEFSKYVQVKSLEYDIDKTVQRYLEIYKQ